MQITKMIDTFRDHVNRHKPLIHLLFVYPSLNILIMGYFHPHGID